MLSKNQSGFGSVEVIAFVFILLLAGVTGLFVYHQDANRLTILPTPSDWATGTLTYEHATFRYPKSWSINVSAPATCGPSPCNASDNTDYILLSGENGFSVDIEDGALSGEFSCPPPKIIHAERIKLVSQNVYVEYLSDNTNGCDQIPAYNGQISAVGLNSSATSWSGGASFRNNGLSITADYTNNDDTEVYMPLSEAESDTNYQDVIKLIESIKYQ